MNMIQHLKQKKNKKGFTLAELLIVIAILAILVAIAVPVFTAQLARAKAATDAANLRSVISVADTELMTNNKTYATKKTEGEVEAALKLVVEASLGVVKPQYKTDAELVIKVSGSQTEGWKINTTTTTLSGQTVEGLRDKAGEATPTTKPAT